MQVFKFGGASVNNVDRIRNLGGILKQYKNENILVVVSAMGKTTNALEKVVESFYSGRGDEALQLFQKIKDSHLEISKYLLVKTALETEKRLQDFFTEVEWLLHDKPSRDFDYYYDQVVCVGELLSTSLVSAYLNEEGIANTWIDVRDIFRTDDNFRDAGIDWKFTMQKVESVVKPLFEKKRILVTQGFIGSTDENESTTLGREGSDYTAAVFANMLDAESQTIWKDVEGVMNSDPKQFTDARFIRELNYDEVIEMAYYGAQVIHPKTIKPLENKNIPLHVKCFLDPSLPGTIIHHKNLSGLPPIVVLKHNQALMQFHSKDFSFVGEKPISQLYEMLTEIKIKPNLMQSGAVTIQLCLDDHAEKIHKLALSAGSIFDVELDRGLTLLTIRHYTPELLAKMTNEKQVVLQQQSNNTVQVLMKS